MKTAEIRAPTRIETCCFHGVAPTRNPVLRSCEVVPPLDDAMQTMPAIDSAVRRYSGPTQPRRTKIRQVKSSVAIVMPGDRVGRRADHAGDARADRDEQEPEQHDHARRRSTGPGDSVGIRCETAIASTSPSEPRKTSGIGRSRSVRATPPASARLPERMSRRLPVTEAMISGKRVEHAQDAAGGDRAGADVADVLTEIAPALHVGDPRCWPGGKTPGSPSPK